MSGPFKISAWLLALGLLAIVASTRAHAQNKVPNNRVTVQSGKGDHHNNRIQLGDWLRQYRGKSFDQQKQSLESDPDYQKLPADRQEQLKQRLQKFNNLPPDQQERVLQRFDKLERMTPQQRAQARALWDRMRLLPEERRNALRQFFHSLAILPHDQRQKALASEQYNQFNPEERDIIQKGLELNDQTPQAPPEH